MAGKPKAPEGETKADKFKRLAVLRTNNALKAIALIRGLAAKGPYEYTEDQVTTIAKALEAEVVKTVGAFAPNAKEEQSGFTL